jgi:hypothetical protein
VPAAVAVLPVASVPLAALASAVSTISAVPLAAAIALAYAGPPVVATFVPPVAVVDGFVGPLVVPTPDVVVVQKGCVVGDEVAQELQGRSDLGQHVSPHSLMEEEEEEVMEEDSLKVSCKRKNLGAAKNNSKVKRIISSSSEESDTELMDDSQPQEQEDRPTDYTFESIKRFLDKTKGHRIQVGKYFPNLSTFIESVKHIGLKKNTGESSDSVFSDQGIFCLKK